MKKILIIFVYILLIYTSAYSQSIILDSFSSHSLYLEQVCNSEKYGRATGFIIKYEDKDYLITNWHVVSGINPFTGDTTDSLKRIPDELIIFHHSKIVGQWIQHIEKLYDDLGSKKWIEHPMGNRVDVVVLEIDTPENINIYPFNLNLSETDMISEVAMPVSIIGYPTGYIGRYHFPIWKTGHIASEPALNYENLPIIFIDATTRGGMSGSPVILRMSGGYKNKEGHFIMGSSEYTNLFLGIYSGQIKVAELGLIWKPIAIRDIFKSINK